MLINVITPVSRPENLPQLRQSILQAQGDSIEVRWILVFDSYSVGSAPAWAHTEYYTLDSAGKGLSGNPQRNLGLDITTEGYVYFLDDDNIVHPGLFKKAGEVLDAKHRAMVVNQVNKRGKRRLQATPGLRPGYVDTAMVIMRRDLIGSLRWEPYNYGADGEFFSTLYQRHPHDFVVLPNLDLSYYNYLR